MEDAANSIRPLKREVIVIDDGNSSNEQPVTKSARRDEEEEKSSTCSSPPPSSTVTCVPRDEEIKEEEEIDMEEEPSKKSVDESPAPSPEIIELQQKVRRLEEQLEGATVVARAAELRAESAEIKLSLLISQLEDSKKVAETSRKGNCDLTMQNQMLRNEMFVMKNERTKDKARIDELGRRFAQSELGMKIKTGGSIHSYGGFTEFAGSLTCARVRPFHSNSALLPLAPPVVAAPSPMTSIKTVVLKNQTAVSDVDPSKSRDGAAIGSPLGPVVRTGRSLSVIRPAMDVSVSGVAAALAHHLAGVASTPRVVVIPNRTLLPNVFVKKRIGRPPKPRDDKEVVKRPQGRPRKSRDDGAKTSPASGTEEVTKRRPGRPSKERDDHWSAMKKAQANVEVKKYTESPEDWTAFDAFLRRNYQRLSASYNEKPSNELALKIKRTLWKDLTRERVPSLWEEDAARFRAEGKKRLYWGSETVIEQEDRVVEDGGVGVVPLGGENKEKGREIETPKNVKIAVNSFATRANYLIRNKSSEIYQDLVKLQSQFNRNYRSIIVEQISSTASVGANSRVSTDRSRRRKPRDTTPKGNTKTERADVSASESDDEQPSTSSSSRRAARHKRGFYRTLDNGQWQMKVQKQD
ncbi:hypothetical protein PENTCL1PPCAC_3997 [Pristionchus entomophagus]|uniref:Uncharacterized protein n=1 Tax=Pristionchus entomophagus TaxID=358040 RepID=A0AAV5SEL8_9BILA|nr:hypothetical protein PENTCL1PPCAC_3997 [Pristionchus entomophagus]